MSNIVLLDAGHGGINNGNYVTSGKRSCKWSDGHNIMKEWATV